MNGWFTRHATFIVLLAAFILENEACPPQCQCSVYIVRCINKGLRVIPKGLPLTARVIDLSSNPSIKIPRDYFLQFKLLFVLRLNNCGQRGPVYLPGKIRKLMLRKNEFTVDALRQMLGSKAKLLESFDLSWNYIQPSGMREVFMMLPSMLVSLCIRRNAVKHLRGEIGRFSKLKIIDLRECSLESIDANSFDNLTVLYKLSLTDNKLSDLPENLLKYNTRLQVLRLNGNKLKTFNATQLGLRRLREIDISMNRLTEVDVKTLITTKISLDHNKIERLDKPLFDDNPFLTEICLNDNKIRYISIDTFKSVKKVATLLLQNNNITSLPSKLFFGMSLIKISLENNNLSTLDDVFHGMMPELHTLDLSGNTQLHDLNGADLSGLTASSKLYITCHTLRRITELGNLRGKILCSHTAGRVIETTDSQGISCHGYICTYNPHKALYVCVACKRGYYSACLTPGICMKCPAGSFYQDQAGSAKCKVCRPGQFVPPERSPGTDPLDCQTCPMGTNTTMIAQTRACGCIHGYARRYRFGPCFRCNSNGFDCSNDYEVLQNGYWMTWQGVVPPEYTNWSTALYSQTKNICYKMYHSFIKNLNVMNDDYDRATMHFNCQMPLPIKCPMLRSCLGGIHPTCSRGYNGVLCAVCDAGYSKRFDQCVKCPRRVWAALQFIACIALFATLCLIISHTDRIIIEESQDSLQRGQIQLRRTYENNSSLQRRQTINHRTLADIILSSLKIVIGFYQVLISIIHALSNIHWPKNLKIAANVLQYIQFQIIKLPSLRCIKPEWDIDAVTEFWFIFIITITVPLLALVFFIIKSLYIYRQYLAPSIAKYKRFICARNCTKVVALYLFATYQLMSTKIIQILPISCHSFCTAKQSGVCVHSMSFLRSDYSIKCPTISDYKATVITGYSSLIIPLGLPLLLLMLLRAYAPKLRRSIQQPITSQVAVNNGFHDDDDSEGGPFDFHMTPLYNDSDNLLGDSSVSVMTSALKFSYENYHARYWYWEVIEMIRRLLMTVGVALFLKHTKIGLTCTIIVAMIFTLLNAVVKPLKNNFESAAQSLSLVLIPLNLAFGVLFKSKETQKSSIINEGQDSVSFGIFLLAINSSLLIALVLRIIIIIGKKIISRVKK